MRWVTWSKPFFGITSALALLQIAQASNVKGAAEVAPVGQDSYALKTAAEVPRGVSIDGKDKINDSSRDISPSTNDEISPAVDNSGESDTYKPIRHDIRRQVDPCTAVSKLTDVRVPYEVAKACLDADFPFPSTLREDTAKTIKTLISNFYVFEDLAARPPTGDHVKGLNFKPVNITGEIDQLLAQSQRSFAFNDDDYLNIDDDEDEDEDEEDEDDAESENEGMVAEDTEAMDSVAAQEREAENKQDDASTAPTTSSMSPFASSPMTHREFHDGLSHILKKARDGHLSYDADCFRTFEFNLGLYINHVVRDGRAVLKVHYVEPYFAETNRLYKDISNCEVVKINGLNAADYVQQWADEHVSSSKDPNIRFNAALARPVYDTPTSERFSYGAFSQRPMLPDAPSLSFEFQCPGYFLFFWPVAPIKVDVKWTARYRRQPFADTSSYYEANCIKPDFGDDEVGHESGHDDHSLNAPPEPRTHAATAPSKKSSTSSSNPKHSADKVPVQDIPTKADKKLTKLDQFAAEQLPVVKYYDDDVLLSDDRTGIITVPSVSPENSSQSFSDFHEEWVGALIEAINTLRPRAENLILDLSRNGGGYICVGTVLMNLFFPDRPRPVTNIRLSPLAKQMMKVGAFGVSGFMSSYGNSTENVFGSDLFPSEITHTGRPGMTFTDYIADRCSIVNQYELYVDQDEESKRKRASSGTTDTVYHPWDPENMAILTDGVCGSTCALISNMMHSKFGVKTVVIGGKSLASAEKMSYSTFPGLQVIDDKFIFDNIRQVQKLKDNRDTEGLKKRASRGDEGKTQKSFAIGNNKEEKEDDDGDNIKKNVKNEQKVEDDKPGYEELDVPYPADFPHKSRLRLTWRQIYRTGPKLEQFVHSEKDGSYVPAWENVEQWNEYSFIPATTRIDYTESNVHSTANIWVDARDAVWGVIV
ncbi:hypothetical protein BGZ72_008914 [Mortierella alpina]|nr:hypothetical protein BGZ72_008914 [Mortierella alpina]